MPDNSFEQFRNLYSLSKTFKFRLIPTDTTLKNLKESNVLYEELQVKENIAAIKVEIDKLHRELIHDALENAELDWEPLANAFLDSKNNPTAYKAECNNMRKKIVKLLSSHPYFKHLTDATPAKLINDELTTILGSDNELVTSMKNKATYLSGYQDIRRHLYDDKENHGTVAYRLIDENFPVFLRIREVFAKILDIRPDIIEEVCSNLSITEDNLNDALSVNGYNRALTQDGIAFINTVIGGLSLPDGTKKRGLNELCNIHNQKTKDKSLRLPMCPALKKQMLVEKVSFSFVADALNSDSDVFDIIENELTALKRNNTFEDAQSCITDIMNGKYNLDEIYIRTDGLSAISKEVFKSWSKVKELILEMYASQKKKGVLTEKEKEKLENTAQFTLGEVIRAAAPEFGGSEELALCNVMSYWAGLDKKVWGLTANLIFSVKGFRNNLDKDYSLRSDDKTVSVIKNLFDDILECARKYRALHVTKYSNVDFAYDYYPLVGDMGSVSRVYDKIRNYITKKPFSTEKIQLNFGNSVLGGGWTDSALKDKCTAIARCDRKYYLIVINSNNGRSKRVIADDILKISTDRTWERLSYKTLDIRKQLPRLLFPKSKEMDENGFPKLSPAVTDEKIKAMYPHYIRGEHKGADADVNFVREIIAYFNDTFAKTNPSFAKYNITTKDPESYGSWNEFCDDLSEQLYDVFWEGLDGDMIESLNKAGDIFLFQIYCLDFSEYSHSKDNEQALIWENFMNDPSSSPFKLLGGAELYFREKSIKKPFVHKEGSILIDKRTKDGFTIPGKVYTQLLRYSNKQMDFGDLTAEAKMYLPKIKTKTADKDIVKDKRYTVDEFFFHVPFTYNANRPNRIGNLNMLVRDWFCNNKDAHVIGINRGENNLVYATVIDRNGNIVEQKSFNVINGVDYHEKLEAKAGDRDEQRKSWATIDNIKNLKEGYLSYVVKIVTDMIFKYNAVVAMEDLNVSFKNGRMAIESNIYKAFESALVSHLQYVCDKTDVTKGYQLTAKSVSMDSLTGQHGMLLFVSPWMTSQTDPKTGFINLFNLNEITNNEKRKDFFSRFDGIVWKNNKAEFQFSYNNMSGYADSDCHKGLWTLTSEGERIVSKRDKESGKVFSESIYPTEIIFDALRDAGIQPKEGLDIKKILSETSDGKLLSAVMEAFRLTLQTRNFKRRDNSDYYFSPAIDENGEHFDTRNANAGPTCTDAVTAYNLARKGLYIMNKDMLDENGKYINGFDRVNKTEWLEYLKS